MATRKPDEAASTTGRRRGAPPKKKKPTAASAPAVASPPADPPKPRVRLRVYITSCGKREQHLKGFVRMVLGQKPEKRTFAEWDAAYEAYMNTPA